MEARPEDCLRVAGKRIDAELLIVATNMEKAEKGLYLYRIRATAGMSASLS
jgi:hypothetical protein